MVHGVGNRVQGHGHRAATFDGGAVPVPLDSVPDPVDHAAADPLTLLGSGTARVAWDFSNTGTVQVQSGTLECDGAYVQSAGGTLLGAGTTLAVARGVDL